LGASRKRTCHLQIIKIGESMTIDRINPDSAHEVIQALIPDKHDRQVYLSFLANSIEIAHSISPKCWGVTLKEDLVRLNVGKIEVISLGEILHCMLDRDTIPSELWKDEIVNLFLNEHDPEVGFYKSVPNSVACNMFIEDAEKVISLIQNSHNVLVENAAQTGKHPMTQKAHSPAVIDFLSSVLGRKIPKPEY
jgi:hypothetical protein